MPKRWRNRFRLSFWENVLLLIGSTSLLFSIVTYAISFLTLYYNNSKAASEVVPLAAAGFTLFSGILVAISFSAQRRQATHDRRRDEVREWVAAFQAAVARLACRAPTGEIVRGPQAFAFMRNLYPTADSLEAIADGYERSQDAAVTAAGDLRRIAKVGAQLRESVARLDDEDLGEALLSGLSDGEDKVLGLVPFPGKP